MTPGGGTLKKFGGCDLPPLAVGLFLLRPLCGMNANAAEFVPPLHVLRTTVPAPLLGGLDGAAIYVLFQRRSLLPYLRVHSSSLTGGEVFLLRAFLAVSYTHLTLPTNREV